MNRYTLLVLPLLAACNHTPDIDFSTGATSLAEKCGTPLDLSSAPVVFMESSGLGEPAPSGGAPVDGAYHLGRYTIYSDQSSLPRLNRLREGISVAGDQVRWTFSNDTAEPSGTPGTVVLDGNMGTFTPISGCSFANPWQFSFSATPTTITLFSTRALDRAHVVELYVRD